MDTIYISGLAVETIIGVHPWERRVRQTVVIDVEMAADIERAAASDELEDALDYHQVATRLVALVEVSDCQLIEMLAARCAALIQAEFAVGWLRLRLAKPGAVAAAREVGVVIERGRRQ